MKRISYLMVLCLLVYLLFFGFGDLIFVKWNTWRLLLLVLVFAGIPFFLYKFLQTFKLERSLLVGKIVPLSILILGPGFGLWTKYVSEQDLAENGKTIVGEVCSREWSSRRPRGWLLRAEFEYNHHKYITFASVEETGHYRIGDPILIRFSVRNPENNELALNGK